MSIRSLGITLIFSGVVGWAAVAPGQVEVIDPNPTMPRDVGGRLTYRGFSGGGGGLGRATGSEENPAETLLRSIEGSNYGRATGHSIFSQRARQRPVRSDVRRQVDSPSGSRTLYYAQRGAYEDRVYQPGRGSYRAMERQRTYYRAQHRQAPSRTSHEATPAHESGHTTEPAARAR